MKKLLASALVALTVGGAAYAQEGPDPAGVANNSNFQIGLLEWVNPETNQREQFFYYRGTIAANSAEELQRAMQLYPNVKKIALESSGGLASESTELGALFSDNGIQTWVPKGRHCLSACANAFVGGNNYKVSGVLGFHAAWFPLTQQDISTMTPNTFNAYYGNGQYNGVRDTYYWMANGFSIQLPAAINGYTSPDNFLVFTSEDQLNEYYVRDDGNEATQPISDYMKFDDTRTHVVWGSDEMVPYLQNQLLELSEEGSPVTLIDLIYTPEPAEVQNEEVE